MARLPNCPHCNSPVRQYTRTELTPTVYDLYANCTNPECEEFGQTLVYQVSYQRTVKRKIDLSLDVAMTVFKSLSQKDQNALIEMARQSQINCIDSNQ